MKPIKLIVKTKSQEYPIIIGSNLVSKVALLIKNNSIKFNKCLLYNFYIQYFKLKLHIIKTLNFV